MLTPLHPSAQKVQDFIDQNDIGSVVIQKETTARTTEEAAKSIGCTVGQIVKSLVFKTKSGAPVLLLVSGSNRVNEKVIKKHLGEKIERPDATFVKEVTGFTIGGIPPFGHRQEVETIFIDEDLLQYQTVRAAAGHPNAVFKIIPSKLVSETNGKVINVL